MFRVGWLVLKVLNAQDIPTASATSCVHIFVRIHYRVSRKHVTQVSMFSLQTYCLLKYFEF